MCKRNKNITVDMNNAIAYIIMLSKVLVGLCYMECIYSLLIIIKISQSLKMNKQIRNSQMFREIINNTFCFINLYTDTQLFFCKRQDYFIYNL